MFGAKTKGREMLLKPRADEPPGAQPAPAVRGRARRRPGLPTPAESARNAALHYVTDRQPGIRRLRAGKGWRYVMAAGAAVRDDETLRRIRALAIPPAWERVWICARADGHLQATGYDARGRKQYRYHPAWRAERDATKYTKMIAFGRALPRLRARVAHDLALPGLPREKVLATIVRLLETTLIRVGNEEYARDNRSFGLTTLRTRHVEVDGATLHFGFRGKSGKRHAIDVHDRRLAAIVKRCRDLPGYELFQYLDDAGEISAVNSADVNAYLHEIAGEEFTAKDFRTWHGTVRAAVALLEAPECSGDAAAKRNVADAIAAVARVLGNTSAICRKCYVHPLVVECYLAGELRAQLRRRRPKGEAAALQPEELALLALLERRG